MKHPNAPCLWRFSVTAWDEDVIYLDTNGESTDDYDTPFIGSQIEAEHECERRSVIYENAHEDDWISESTTHAIGLVDPSLYLVPEEGMTNAKN